MVAKVNASIARKAKKGTMVDMPEGLEDSKSMAEFYAELLSFAPSILN